MQSVVDHLLVVAFVSGNAGVVLIVIVVVFGGIV